MWLMWLNIAWTCGLVIVCYLMRRYRKERAEFIMQGIDSLRSSETAVVSLCGRVDGSEAVCVIDLWTGFNEQCFYNDTLEGAIAHAMEARDVSRRRKGL